MFDSFNMVYNQGQIPELKNTDTKIVASVKKAEDLESIMKRISRIYRMGATGNHKNSIRAFLSRYSRLYGLLRGAYKLYQRNHSVAWENAKAFAEANSAYCQIFVNGEFKTIFTSEYRLSALDMQDIRIVEGLRISLEAIMLMNELATQHDKRFLVLLIPTKEFVFHELVRKPSPSYLNLIQNEKLVWKATKEFFEKNDIEYVDVFPAFREQLSTGILPYQVSHDGHPNEHGHLAIANFVYTQVKGNQNFSKNAEKLDTENIDKSRNLMLQ